MLLPSWTMGDLWAPWSGRNMQRSLFPIFVLELIKFMEWLGRKDSFFGAELMRRWDMIHVITSLKNEFHLVNYQAPSPESRCFIIWETWWSKLHSWIMLWPSKWCLSLNQEWNLVLGDLQYGKNFPGKHNNWDAFLAVFIIISTTKRTAKSLVMARNLKCYNKTIKTGKPTYYIC